MSKARQQANLSSDGNLFADISNDRVGIGSVVPTHKLHVAGTSKFDDDVKFEGTTAAKNIIWDKSADVLKISDTIELQFGSSAELKLSNNGNAAYMQHSGSGYLFIHGNDIALRSTSQKNYIVCDSDNEVTLYFNNSPKFETTNTGAKVTGNLEVTGVLTYDDVTSIDSVGIVTARQGIHSKGETDVQNSILRVTDSTPRIIMSVPSGGLDTRLFNDGSGNFIIGHGVNSDTPTERLRIKSGGDIVATGNLKTNNITGRNLVINGNFMIDQRNEGAELSITSNNKFSADRWTHNNDGFTYYKTQRRNDNSIQTTGEEYYMRVTVTTAVTLSGSTSQCLENNLEGYTVKHLNYGTPGAKQCTVSFWVRSSLTGTFGGALQNKDYNRCHPFSYTISSANQWEYKTYTFSTTGFTTGSFHTGNQIGLRLVFSLGNGPGRQADPANGWSTQTRMGPTGETNLVATNGATLDISSVQLEEGTQATKFEHRSYGEELSRCQRYFVSYGNTGHFHFGMGTAYNSSALNITVPLPVPMRGEPTVAKISNGSSDWLQAYVGASGTISNPTPQLGESGMSVYRVYVPSAGSGWTAGQSFWCQIRPDARLTFSAEL